MRWRTFIVMMSLAFALLIALALLSTTHPVERGHGNVPEPSPHVVSILKPGTCQQGIFEIRPSCGYPLELPTR